MVLQISLRTYRWSLNGEKLSKLSNVVECATYLVDEYLMLWSVQLILVMSNQTQEEQSSIRNYCHKAYLKYHVPSLLL